MAPLFRVVPLECEASASLLQCGAVRRPSASARLKERGPRPSPLSPLGERGRGEGRTIKVLSATGCPGLAAHIRPFPMPASPRQTGGQPQTPGWLNSSEWCLWSAKLQLRFYNAAPSADRALQRGSLNARQAALGARAFLPAYIPGFQPGPIPDFKSQISDMKSPACRASLSRSNGLAARRAR